MTTALLSTAVPRTTNLTYRINALSYAKRSNPVTTTEVVNLYGAAWSVYVRIARLALEEKQIKYNIPGENEMAFLKSPTQGTKQY